MWRHKWVLLPVSDVREALDATKADVVCISTYPDSHVEIGRMALKAGAHVFVEKPLAPTVPEAESLLTAARESGQTLLVGYILRSHPEWQRFVRDARALSSPLVMRFSLNQRSSGSLWNTHRELMKSANPVVDSGVHYVDVMCQMTSSRPISVNGVGARLSEEVDPTQVNYGHLQVLFEDGSVGWFEAGWGPMISDEAATVRDVFGPQGSAQLPAGHDRSLDELCALELEWFLDAIEGRVDLQEHHRAALDSLRVVLAAEESMKSRRTISL